MKHMTKILIFALCITLSMSSCTKRHHTPDTPDLKTPISFSALSQDATVKSVTKADFPSNTDFGVWGIARASQSNPYILWPNGLEQITKQGDVYKPAIDGHDAFWVKDYTYHFMAVAPYTGLGTTVTPTSVTSGGATKDALSFSYSLANKYNSSVYDFDLLGAAAIRPVDANFLKGTGTQHLKFWHLFTTINIDVDFKSLKENEVGRLTQIVLKNVDTDADYVVTFDDEPAQGQTKDMDYPLSVTCLADDPDVATEPLANITFTTFPEDGNVIRMVPQSINSFRLYLSFAIGTVNENGNFEPKVTTENFEVNLANAKDDPASQENQNRGQYRYNERYYWKINISPKEISFNVTVTDWDDVVDDFEFPIE